MNIGDRVRVKVGDRMKTGKIEGFFNNGRNCLVRLKANKSITSKKPASWLESFFVADITRC